MRARKRIHAGRIVRSFGIGWLLFCWSSATVTLGDDGGQKRRDESARSGAELFEMEWTPGEPSQHGGDGLGPVYNDTSCVACHNLGGVGGAGPSSKNVVLISSTVTPVLKGRASKTLAESQARMQEIMARSAKLRGKELPKTRADGESVNRNPLIELHRGFEESSVVVVHRFGPEKDYEMWRLGVLEPDNVLFMGNIFGGEGIRIQQSVRISNFSIPTKYGHFTLASAELNPAPLFGTGLIDSIPDEVIVAASEKSRFIGFRKIQGRVSRLSDGRIGRFGWKAQAASLDGFVLTACAVELGLEVPGHSQADNPRSPNVKAPGLDLSRSECQSLTRFVRGLPAPIENIPANPDEAAIVATGRAAFDRIGCTACHLPKLGRVEGIYSDLLLHEMGFGLSDAGSYTLVTPDSDDNNGVLPGSMPNGPLAFEGAKPPVKGPARSEWRTPPLWGVRDSGPYLHDGRAETIEQAISFHDGEALIVANSYFNLPPGERRAVLRFLKSLQAPTQRATRENRREAPDLKVPADAVGLR